MKMRLALLLLALSSGPAQAWSAWGHHLVARMAYDDSLPAVRQWVDVVLRQHSDPNARTLELASAWPDVVRRERPETRPWHFIDLPVLLGAAPLPPRPIDPQNVTWAVDEMRRRVVAGSGGERAEALAFLIHFVADVHQPLHSACVYSEAYPEGDNGGNRIGVTPELGGNLHHFWDEGGALHPDNLRALEAELRREHPRQSADVEVQDPRRWADETHKLGEAAYRELAWEKLPELTPTYVDRARVVARERLAVAAYRLSETLSRLYRQTH